MKTALLTIITSAALFAQCNASTNNAAPGNNTDTTNTTTDTVASVNVTAPQTPAATTFNVQQSSNDSLLALRHITSAVEYMASMPSHYDAEMARRQLLLHIARSFKGIPYVAKTLENDSTENLVVNLRQLDCTTYVENVLAVYECVKNGKTAFADFLSYLRQIRYVGGRVAYNARQHYFTEWIEENTKKGFVYEVGAPNPPFSARQTLQIDFMSTHTALYPMLKNNPSLVKPIADMEQRLSGKSYMYIPKGSIKNTKQLRAAIHDGDIIAIITKKKGLDTSHIGIAVWHNDGLHMLNASQIHKKVVEEPMTLYEYMQKHPSQIGIRIARVK